MSLKRSKFLVVILGFYLFPAFVLASQPLEVSKAQLPPVIDGSLDDSAWQTAAKFTELKTFKPDYKKDLSQKTEVFMTYDEGNFYFAFRCYDNDPNKIKAAIRKRDTLEGDDWVGLCLDTFNDEQTAFCFILNPLGIQVDGMLNLDGDLDASLDMVWFSKGMIDDQGYVVEFKVPLKSIRFPGKKKINMGVMFFRTIGRTSEQASFPMVIPEGGGMLTQTQKIIVSGLKYKRVMEFLPAFTHSQASSIDQGELKADEKESDISLTAKLGFTSDLTLDGTYNPDFSQVEADAGQIDVNLRYDLFYPEKRPFFLEGSDNFEFSGNTEDSPLQALVHTRKIVDPLLGLKLSGRIAGRTSFTTLYAIDEFPGKEKDAQGNYLHEGKNAYFSILRFRQPMKEDSYIGGFFTARDFLDGYNRVIGSDGRFRLSRYALLEYHALGSLSLEEADEESEFGHALALRYQYISRKVILDLGVQDLSDDFRVDTGFITRKDISRLAVFGMYRFYPASKIFQRIEPFYWSSHIYDKESGLFETFNLFTLRFWLPRQTIFRVDFIAANEVFASQRFDCSGIGFQAESQFTKHLYFSIFYRYTGNIFYNPEDPFQGKGSRASVALIYQPLEKFNTRLSIAYADFYRSGDSERIYDYTILRNHTTLQINKYLFFRGIVEYNSYWKRITTDLLASFTYIPGTVVHLGYGSIFEKIQWQDPDYVPADRFLETKRGLFFKVSYLWRW